ncbi:hypothetical protein PBI_THONKO_71 [Mycobacterium phage Thonko]|uniref:Uncharacterized protein n=1 Tax=Mycobacterium phage Thonko TaxID=2282910 RepID=A0A346FCB7_9CAUD|nr:hypothetical protein I5G57_gp071 [Mycobacterium phage Thonko]AXN53342.1 hypothetical protein PBI_THONKO_71 [Mycobacterium phage Thonko]
MTMTAVGTVVPELTDEHRDGTIWADADLALWSPVPAMFGGGWCVTTRLPFGITQDHLAEGTRTYGPYVAVMPPVEEGGDDAR